MHSKRFCDSKNHSQTNIEKVVRIDLDQNKLTMIYKPFGYKGGSIISNEVPISLLQNLVSSTSLNFLSFNQKNLSSATGVAESIIRFIRFNKSVMFLDLTNCSIDIQVLKNIASSFSHNSTITQLILDSNNIEIEGFEALLASLKNNSSLNYLSIANTGMSSEKISAISRLLIENKTLKVLDLSNNDCDILSQVSHIVASNDTLNTLNLNGIKTKHDDFETLIKSLSINTSVYRLNMRSASLGDTGAKMFSVFLATNTSLVSINLLFNEITYQGAIDLITGLKHNESILEFHVESSFKEPIPIILDAGIKEYINRNVRLFEDTCKKIDDIKNSEKHDQLQLYNLDRLINQLNYYTDETYYAWCMYGSSKVQDMKTENNISMRSILEYCYKRAKTTQDQGRDF